MGTFLDTSQEIKEEVKNSPQIIQAIRDCFEHGKSEPFLHGTTHAVHRIGTTASGAHLMFRKQRFSSKFANEAESFDIFCQNAETLANTRESGRFKYRAKSPGFCIGVKCGDMAGVITEDMSEGGKYEMTNKMSEYTSSRILNGAKIDEVLVDLDDCHTFYFRDDEIRSTTEFFSEENILII